MKRLWCVVLVCVALWGTRAEGAAIAEGFENWPPINQFGLTVTNAAGWVAKDVGILGQPSGFSSKAGIMADAVGPYIESPECVDGVQRITYNASCRIPDTPIGLVVLVSEDGAPWRLVVLHSVQSTTWQWFSADIGVDGPCRVRIVRIHMLGVPFAYVCLDDITISSPACDVGIGWEAPMPLYPSISDDVVISCTITSAVPSALASNLMPELFYRHDEGAWSSFSMELGAGDVWSATVPAVSADSLEYYVRCEFDGEFYTHTPTGVSEARSPSFFPDAEHTALRPDSFERIELGDATSAFESLTLVEDTGTALGMALVGDSLWQAIVPFEGAATRRFRIDGGGDTPEVWGSSNMWWGVSPLNDVLEAGVSNVFPVTATERGHVCVRFDTSVAELSLQRAVHQAFDEWLGDQLFFNEGRTGLFSPVSRLGASEWDLDEYFLSGDYAWNNFQHRQVDSDWVEGPMHESFFVVCNAKIVAEGLDRYDNWSARQALCLRATAAGSVGSTGFSTPDGIDKVAFSARLSLDGGRRCRYMHGDGWTNYVVTAEMRMTDASEHTASFSLFACDDGAGSFLRVYHL